MYQVNFSDQAIRELAKLPTLEQMEVVEAFSSLTPEELLRGRSDDELRRGRMALTELYGQSGPGGIVNLTSKMPQFVRHGEVFVQGGGFSEVRGGFDVGGPITSETTVPGTEEFAYRVTGLGWNGDGPAVTTKVERAFINPSLTWRPSADTSLTIIANYQRDPFSGFYGGFPAVGTVFPRNFGNGDIRGVAAPESANNAGAQTSFIPMLTLGLPSNPTMAMMIGALMIHGIAPGPRVMTERPELFWGVIASMWIGNLLLVVLNLPLVGMWVKLLRIPYRLLFPAIIGFCCIGAYVVNTNLFDIYVLAFFAVFGYLCLKLECEPAPLILGFVLGPLMEENLRRALLISRGDPRVFVEEPISLAFLIAAALLLVVVAAPAIRRKREEALQE